MDTITDYSHISETEMNEIICDYSIDNDGSIEQAFNKLMQIVGRHNGY
jgi:ribose 1,5-bisphosphokinase PhnN